MGRDFYKILGVSRSASQEDIKKAYKKMALKWHPDRVAPDKKDEAQSKFQDIGEAFEVLSDPQKKNVYDQVGEDGMKGSDGGASGFGGGMPPGFGGGGPGAHTFHFGGGGGRGADDIFRQFFGTSDPFAARDDDDDGFPGFMGGMGGMGARMGQRARQQPLQKSPPIHHFLNVNLEDVYSGTVKRMRITKKVLDASGVSTSVSVDKEISVKPGWKDGTKITFSREGDELPGREPADIVFELKTRPHARFMRDGDDLHLTQALSLRQALCGARYSVTTLDGRTLELSEERAAADSVKIVTGEGMPSKKGGRGDLIIKYDITFPRLTQSERESIGTILQQAEDREMKM